MCKDQEFMSLEEVKKIEKKLTMDDVFIEKEEEEEEEIIPKKSIQIGLR